jgi:signal transduction histidine kinase
MFGDVSKWGYPLVCKTRAWSTRIHCARTSVLGAVTRVESSSGWIQFVWSERTLLEQAAVIALIALLCGALFAPRWIGDTRAPGACAAIAALAMLGVLLAIIARSSDAVAASRSAARKAEEERAQVLEQNADLRRQIDETLRPFVEIHDMVLRRVGVELHDGPAQLISLALLRLDGLLPQEAAQDRSSPFDDFERIRAALQEALGEIRSMSAGLILPELSGVSPTDVLRLAARNHERRTAAAVKCEVEGLPQHVPGPVKSCLYRFVQEALNNAYRHAGGRGQTLRGRYCGETIEVEVADAGPGFSPDGIVTGNHLGLLGMRERVSSLGGTLEIESRPGSGTRLITRFKIGSLQR